MQEIRCYTGAAQMTESLATPIAASSLLMTMLALVYNAWASEIRNAMGRIFSAQDEERKAEQRATFPTLLFRALPLTVVTWTAAIIFWPRAQQIWATVGPPYDLARIDDVGGAYIITHLLIVGVACSISVDTVRLGLRLRK